MVESITTYRGDINMVAMKAEDLPAVTFEQLDILTEGDIRRNIPFFLHSEPGMGKSSWIDDLAKRIKRKLIVFSAPEHEAIDGTGVMYVDRTTNPPLTRWAPVSWVIENQNTDVLFLVEEITRGEKPVKNMLLRVFGPERMIGDTPIPESWALCGASNPYGIGTSAFPEALGNRVQHYLLKSNPKDWDKSLRKAGKSCNNIVVGFLCGFGLEFFSQYEAGALTCPSARQWSTVGKVVDEYDANFPANQDLMVIKLSGIVGKAAAISFIGYWKNYKQYSDPSAILSNPLGAVVPHDASAKYAVAHCLSGLISSPDSNGINEFDKTKFSRYLTYVDRIGKEHTHMFLRESEKRYPEIGIHPDFRDWNVKNEDFILCKV